MGVQLIFTVETNKKCNSDWIYIKDTVEYFMHMSVHSLNSAWCIWTEKDTTAVKRSKTR